MSWKDEVRGRIDDCCFSSDYSWILMRILDHMPEESQHRGALKDAYNAGYEEGRAAITDQLTAMTWERDAFRDSLAEEVKKNDDLQRQLHAIREILK